MPDIPPDEEPEEIDLDVPATKRDIDAMGARIKQSIEEAQRKDRRRRRIRTGVVGVVVVGGVVVAPSIYDRVVKKTTDVVAEQAAITYHGQVAPQFQEANQRMEKLAQIGDELLGHTTTSTIGSSDGTPRDIVLL